MQEGLSNFQTEDLRRFGGLFNYKKTSLDNHLPVGTSLKSL